MLRSSEEQNKNTTNQEGQSATLAEARTNRIRELNDQLRATGRGGIVLMTNGIATLAPDAVSKIFKAVGSFTGFGPDNDPWEEHDCASLEVDDHTIIWKIDYYDRAREFHSPDPANPKATVRVLTVMLAAEY